MRPRLFAPVVLVSLALAACASRGARRGDGGDSAILEVQNSYPGPITLYAIRDNGFVQRIGNATSSAPQRFRLGPSLIGGVSTLRIIAVPLAENGRASTGTITVRPGDVVQFNVAVNLNASSVFVR